MAANETHPYRLSDSTFRILHDCERKFKLLRLCKTGDDAREYSPATVRGTAFGIGIQTYLLTQDITKAIYETWKAYWPSDCEDRPYVSCARTINNLIVARSSLDKLLERYEVASFNGKPAIELSFRLNKKGSKWHFVGFVDVVLYDRQEGIYVVLEIKTTGLKLQDIEPAYGNQNQALAYSVIIDKIAGEKQSKYGVLYLVCRDKGKDPIPDVFIWSFKKTLTDRLAWFITYGLDLQRIEQMEELDFFPMRGTSCLSWMRPCTFYKMCGMESLLQMKRAIPEKEEVYDFVYDLDEIVEDHLQRVSEM